jgi:hypothetical protein
MSTQEKIFSLLRDYGFSFALIFDVVIEDAHQADLLFAQSEAPLIYL